MAKIATTPLAACMAAILMTVSSSGSAAAPASSIEPRIGMLCIKVFDLQRALDFYTKVLGMKEQRRLNTTGGVVEVLLGYGDLQSTAGVMLMHDPKRTKPYELGDGFSRFIVYVPDIQGSLQKLQSAGAQVTVKPTRVESLGITIMIAKDPDGYAMEIIQRDAPK